MTTLAPAVPATPPRPARTDAPADRPVTTPGRTSSRPAAPADQPVTPPGSTSSSPAATADQPVTPPGSTSSSPAAALRHALALAEDRQRWSRLVRFDRDERYYVRLEATDSLEAWLLTWLPGQRTGWHDHGGSAGAFVVVQGSLREQRLTASPAQVTDQRLLPGDRRAFGPEYVHDVTSDADAAVSIHVYAPRLTSMSRYDLVDGQLVVRSRERAGQDW